MTTKQVTEVIDKYPEAFKKIGGVVHNLNQIELWITHSLSTFFINPDDPQSEKTFIFSESLNDENIFPRFENKRQMLVKVIEGIGRAVDKNKNRNFNFDKKKWIDLCGSIKKIQRVRNLLAHQKYVVINNNEIGYYTHEKKFIKETLDDKLSESEKIRKEAVDLIKLSVDGLNILREIKMVNEQHTVVVSSKDEILGTMPRKDAHRNGTPHRIAVIYIENSKGEILVQVRANNGKLDHSCAGHVDPGESYLDTAKRELMEELAIKDVELVSIGKGKSEDRNAEKNEHVVHVFEVFVCQTETFTPDPSEVKSVYWANPHGVITEMKTDPNREKFSGGFIASLPIYMASKK